MLRIPKPQPDEYLAYYGKYIALVGEDAMSALRSQAASTPRLLKGVTESQAMCRQRLSAGRPRPASGV